MDVRVEAPADRKAVRDIHLSAFSDDGQRVADLVDDLRQTITPEGGLSLVAELDGQLAGHVMFSRSLLDAPRRLVPAQVLSPLAVRPDYQKRGIGSTLVQCGLRMLAARPVPVVFVEGDPGYYSRFGFVAGADQGFRKPSLRIPDHAFQACGLPAYEPWMTGTLVYAEPFWRHDVVGLRDPGRRSSRDLTEMVRVAEEAGMYDLPDVPVERLPVDEDGIPLPGRWCDN